MPLHQGKTQQQWTDEINATVVDDMPVALLLRIVPGASYSTSDPVTYASISMANKPSLQTFQDELAQWKVEQLAEITNIFADLIQREALQARMDALDLAEAVEKEGLQATWNNMALLEKHILDNNDEALLSSLEAHASAIAADKAKAAGIELALKAAVGGKRIVAYMNALNAAKSLTTEQVKTLLQNTDINLIKSMLESGSLLTAKAEIEAYTPDGTLITAADKTAILAELNSLLGV